MVFYFNKINSLKRILVTYNFEILHLRNVKLAKNDAETDKTYRN